MTNYELIQGLTYKVYLNGVFVPMKYRRNIRDNHIFKDESGVYHIVLSKFLSFSVYT